MGVMAARLRGRRSERRQPPAVYPEPHAETAMETLENHGG